MFIVSSLPQAAREDLEQCCYCSQIFPLSDLISHAQNCDQRTASSSQVCQSPLKYLPAFSFKIPVVHTTEMWVRTFIKAEMRTWKVICSGLPFSIVFRLLSLFWRSWPQPLQWAKSNDTSEQTVVYVVNWRYYLNIKSVNNLLNWWNVGTAEVIIMGSYNHSQTSNQRQQVKGGFRANQLSVPSFLQFVS